MISSGHCMFRRAVALFLSLGLLGTAHAEGSSHKLKVVTSFLPVYCITAGVVGDLATVTNLLPPGVGPHDYQFAPSDMRKLAAADVVVVNGLGLETWLDRAITSSGAKGRIVVAELSAGLESRLIRPGEVKPALEVPGQSQEHADEHHGVYDPHFWMDPQLAAAAASNLVAILQKADPGNAAGYAQNAARFVEGLEKLDREMATALAPVKARPFITFHSAFNYFVRRYELNLAGVIEAVPDVNPSPRYLAGLLKTIRESKVKVVFTEPQFSPKLAQQIAADVHVTVASLDTLEIGELKPGTYEQVMRRNLKTLLETLK